MDIINFAIHAVFWMLGFLFLFRIPRCQTGNPHSGSYPSFSIIIPACNEAKRLPILLASLQGQSLTPGEIIVVVNQSQDNTLDIAKNAGVVAIQSEPLHEGWMGKPWACYQGAKAAHGELLIFLDADTFLEKDGLEKILGEYLENGGAVSIQPYHRMKRPYEQFSAFFNLIEMAAMGAFTITGKHAKPIGLFGPCIAVSREIYFEIGGHQRVKNEIVEDIGLGEGLKSRSIPINCYGGKSTISFRMYPNGIRELISGWSKNLATGASKTHLAILLAIIAWIGGGIGCLVYLVEAIMNMNAVLVVSWIALYALYAIQINWMLNRIGAFRPYTTVFYFVFLLFFLGIFMYSLFVIYFKKSVVWRGNKISLKNRRSS